MRLYLKTKSIFQHPHIKPENVKLPRTILLMSINQETVNHHGECFPES